MKKLLALVLALVMTLSLCVTSNAAFTDADKVSADFEEAVAVLSGMGVFKGYEDGSFQPEGSITRAEVAAIVYRLYTGDVKDKQAGLYAGYGKFDDMAGAQWAAGYVGFCANAGFVKGYGNGKFGPSDPVTGYQALAMILRAVGYGQNGEFEGADWELHVAQIAQQLKVLKNVKNVSLKAAASRELVAELLFQVAAYVNTVTYTSAFGYQETVLADTFKTRHAEKNETLGKKNFDLTKSADGHDAWGRPQYKWYEDKNDNNTVETKETVYATVKATPVMTFTEATTYCDICDELGEDEKAEIELVWINGDDSAKYNNKTELLAKDTKSKMGAQGQLVEVYDEMGDDEDQYRFVLIDTYLAKVTKVSDLEYDKNDHLKADAKIDLEVYGAQRRGNLKVTLTDDEANFGYEKGDYVLVNVNNNPSKSVIVGVADSVDAKQTKLFLNAAKHEIGGEVYMDAAKFVLDAAGTNDDDKFTWFFDQYGNVIGNIAIFNAKQYAAVSFIEWVDVKGADDYASANLVYMDGTTAEEVVVEKLNGQTGAKLEKLVEDYLEHDVRGEVEDYLFEVKTNDDDEVTLTVVNPEDGEFTVKTGKANLEPAATLKINDNTVFLVREGKGTKKTPYTWESVTGYNQIEKIVNATVTMVDFEKDDPDFAAGYAKYVYVYGDDAAVNDTQYLFFTGKETAISLDDEKVGDKFEWTATFTGVVDMNGEEFEDGISVTFVTDTDNKNTVKNTVQRWINGNQGKLFKATSVDGVYDSLEFDEVNACAHTTDAKVNDVEYDAYGFEREWFKVTGNDLEVGHYWAAQKSFNVTNTKAFSVDEDGKLVEEDATDSETYKGYNVYAITKDGKDAPVTIFLTKANMKGCDHWDYTVELGSVLKSAHTDTVKLSEDKQSVVVTYKTGYEECCGYDVYVVDKATGEIVSGNESGFQYLAYRLKTNLVVNVEVEDDEVTTYDITFHENGGSEVTVNTDNTYDIEDSDITLTASTKKGYTFDGWYTKDGTDNDWGTKVEKIAAGSTGDKEFYAKWTENTYVVSFVLRKANNDLEQTVIETVTYTEIDTYKTAALSAWGVEVGGGAGKVTQTGTPADADFSTNGAALTYTFTRN